MKFSAHEFERAAQGIFPRSVGAGTVNGTGVDKTGYEELLAVLNTGTFGAGATLDVKLQDSADNVTFADISGAAFAQVTDALDEKIYAGRVNLQEVRQYIRVVAVSAVGTTVYGVSLELLAKKYPPATQENTLAFNV